MGCFFIRMTPEDPRYSDPYVYFFLFEPHTHTHTHTHTHSEEKMTPIYVTGSIVLTPVSDKKTKVVLMNTVREKRMRYVPNWLLSAILKVYTPRTFATMNELVKIAAAIQDKDDETVKKKSDSDLKVCDAVVNRIRKNPSLYANFLTARANAVLVSNTKVGDVDLE